MKRVLFFLTLLALLVATGTAQKHSEGNIGIVYTVHAFSEVSVSDINGGAGLRYFLNPNFSLRGTFGYATHDEGNVTAASGALLFGVATTSTTAAYIAPQVTVYHTDGQETQSVFGAVLGTEFYPWQNISLGAEYGFTITNIGGNTEVSVGHTGGSILGTFWF